MLCVSYAALLNEYKDEDGLTAVDNFSPLLRPVFDFFHILSNIRKTVVFNHKPRHTQINFTPPPESIPMIFGWSWDIPEGLKRRKIQFFVEK